MILALFNFDNILILNIRNIILPFIFSIIPAFIMIIVRAHISLKNRAGLLSNLYMLNTILSIISIYVISSLPLNHETIIKLIILQNTIFSWLIMLVCLLFIIKNSALKLGGFYGAMRDLKGNLKKVFTMGWQTSIPIGVDNLVFIGALLVVNRYWIELSPVQSVATFWLMSLSVIPVALAQAALQIVSVLHGANDFANRNRVAVLAVICAIICGLLIMSVFYTYPEQMIQFIIGDFVTNNNTVVFIDILHSAGIVFLIISVLSVVSAVLKAIGKTFFPMIITVCICTIIIIYTQTD